MLLISLNSGQPIPRVEYTEAEVNTWLVLYLQVD